MKAGLLYTGGTIGCVETKAGLSPLNAEDFETAFTQIVVPIIQNQYKDFTIDYIRFNSDGTTLDSTNLQPGDWCKIATKILKHYNTCDFFIVLHGTDTMAWTASALSFLLTGLDQNGDPNALLSKPVIITGAQLPLFKKVRDAAYMLRYNTDALKNVCGAVTSCHEGVPEVCLYFDSTLMRGNRTVKTSANEFNAFSTPNYPHLGEYGIEFRLNKKRVLPLPTIPSIALDNNTAYEALKSQLKYLSANINSTVVMPFPAFPAYFNTFSTPNTSVLSNMLSACINQGINGLIMESYGEGNLPSGNPTTPSKGAIYKTLSTAHENGVILIDCTQVLSGIVNSQAYAAGSWLKEVGAVGAYDMTPIAALTKLIYLNVLAKYDNHHWSQSKIEELMLTNLAGEIMFINTLAARGNRYLTPGESIIALDGSAYLLNDPDKGPLLMDYKGNEIFKFPLLSTTKFPGQLHMQEDGNLVFYDRDNQAVYATGTFEIGTRQSRLILGGSYTKGNLTLYVENRNVSIETHPIYKQG